MKVKINDNFKIGIMSLSDVIGFEYNYDLIQGKEIELDEEKANNLIEFLKLNPNYQESLIIDELFS